MSLSKTEEKIYIDVFGDDLETEREKDIAKLDINKGYRVRNRITKIATPSSNTRTTAACKL